MPTCNCTSGLAARNRAVYLNYSGFWHGDFQIVQEARDQQLVNEHAVMLGIIPELNNVPIAVIRFEQVRLGAPSHLAHVANGHERIRQDFEAKRTGGRKKPRPARVN